MGYHQARHVLQRKQPLPEGAFCLHVQGAAQIIDHQQLRLADKHPGRGRALDLTAGEFHPARADHGLQPLFQHLHVALHDRRPHRARQIRPRDWEAEQHVISQRLAKQTRDLRDVRRAGSHEESCRMLHRLPVPIDLTGIAGQQADEHAHQSALAGADPPGHHGE